MKFDQYEDMRPEQVELARAVTVLLSVMIDKDGKPRDLADKEGREALRQTIDRMPREIPANLREDDRKLLWQTIEEARETRKLMKQWWWWIVGLMAIASAAISLCVVMILR